MLTLIGLLADSGAEKLKLCIAKGRNDRSALAIKIFKPSYVVTILTETLIFLSPAGAAWTDEFAPPELIVSETTDGAIDKTVELFLAIPVICKINWGIDEPVGIAFFKDAIWLEAVINPVLASGKDEILSVLSVISSFMAFFRPFKIASFEAKYLNPKNHNKTPTKIISAAIAACCLSSKLNMIYKLKNIAN